VSRIRGGDQPGVNIGEGIGDETGAHSDGSQVDGVGTDADGGSKGVESGGVGLAGPGGGGDVEKQVVNIRKTTLFLGQFSVFE